MKDYIIISSKTAPINTNEGNGGSKTPVITSMGSVTPTLNKP
jgi:hypothetical protein